MLWNETKRLVREDAGMEMVEWSIVGVVFALAGALVWSTLKTQINSGSRARSVTASATARLPVVGAVNPLRPVNPDFALNRSELSPSGVISRFGVSVAIAASVSAGLPLERPGIAASRHGVGSGVPVLAIEHDVRCQRIPNWLTGGGLAAALALAARHARRCRARVRARRHRGRAGRAVPPFVVRWLGAGDVKAMMVLGALWGYELVLPTLFWMFMAGGGLAIALLTRAASCAISARAGGGAPGSRSLRVGSCSLRQRRARRRAGACRSPWRSGLALRSTRSGVPMGVKRSRTGHGELESSLRRPRRHGAAIGDRVIVGSLRMCGGARWTWRVDWPVSSSLGSVRDLRDAARLAGDVINDRGR